MQLSEDDIFEKNAKNCGHYNQNNLLPHTNEWSCISCGFILIKRKHELSKTQRKKNNFINRLKYAEQNLFCICIDVYKIYEGNDYVKIYEFLSTFNNKKLKINNILIEKFKDMLQNPNSEQDYYSRTAISLYRIGHESTRSMKWLAYFD